MRLKGRAAQAHSKEYGLKLPVQRNNSLEIPGFCVPKHFNHSARSTAKPMLRDNILAQRQLEIPSCSFTCLGASIYCRIVGAAAMDRVSREKRSEMMSFVRAKNTRPELAVRRLLHAMGFRFRLHKDDLPGKPDIVLPKKKTAIFVHGCFWHRHKGCVRTTTPENNCEFWADKFRRNKLRDQSNRNKLKRLGWKVVIVWECETAQMERLRQTLAHALVSLL